MIKLKELKRGDIIYQVYKYHWMRKVEITHELQPFPYQYPGEPQIYYVEGKNADEGSWNYGGRIQFFENEEVDIFKTLQEAENYAKQCRNDHIIFLKKNNNIIKKLYEKAYPNLTNADKSIYEELIKDIKIEF